MKRFGIFLLALLPISCRTQSSTDSAYPEFPLAASYFYQNNVVESGRIGQLFDGDLMLRYNPGSPEQLKNTARHQIVLKFPSQWNAIVKEIRIHAGEFGSDFKGKPTEYFLQRRDNGKLVRVAGVIGIGGRLDVVDGDSKTHQLNYQAWTTITVPTEFVADRLIIIGGGEFGDGAGNFYGSELKIFGHFKNDPPPPMVPMARVPLKNLIGGNGHEWDVIQDPSNPTESMFQKPVMVKLNKYDSAGYTGFRHYLNWYWIEASEGVMGFNPGSGPAGWFYDSTYAGLKRKGIEPLLCLQTIPSWMQDTWDPSVLGGHGREDVAPVKFENRDKRNEPASYREYGRAWYQIAARYGSNASIPLSKIATPYQWNVNYRPAAQKKAGLNYVKYYQLGNENDKNWKSDYHYQAPEFMFWQWSVAYDGHKGSLGDGVGIKKADSNAVVVTGALSSASPEMLRALVDLSIEHRGYRLYNGKQIPDVPWDIIAYHKYSTNGTGGQYGSAVTCALPPEVGNAMPVADAFAEFTGRNLNGMPVWLTEWGYDRDPESTFAPEPLGSYSIEETGAMYAVRSIFMYLSKGFGRMHYFTTFDDNPGNPDQFFSTSSVFTSTAPAVPGVLRPDYRVLGFYLAQLKRYGEFQFDTLISRSPYVMRLKHPVTQKRIYAIWSVGSPVNSKRKKFFPWASPAYQEATVQGFRESKGNYVLNVSGPVKIRQFRNNAVTMQETVTNASGRLTVPYGAKPVIIEEASAGNN